MQEEWEPGTHARVLKEAARANRTDVIQAVLKHFRQGGEGTSWPDEADGSDVDDKLARVTAMQDAFLLQKGDGDISKKKAKKKKKRKKALSYQL